MPVSTSLAYSAPPPAMAAPTTRPPIGPPNRVPMQQPPDAGAERASAGRDVGRLGDVRGAVGVATDDHRVVQLEIVVLLQPGRGQQELLRLERVVEGDDEQLAVVRRGMHHRGRCNWPYVAVATIGLGAVAVVVVVPVARAARTAPARRDCPTRPAGSCARPVRHGPSRHSAAITRGGQPSTAVLGATSTARDAEPAVVDAHRGRSRRPSPSRAIAGERRPGRGG